MKRAGQILLSILALLLLLSAFLQWDLLPAPGHLLARWLGGERVSPAPRGDEQSAASGTGEEDGFEPPAADLKELARQITAGVAGDQGKLNAIYDWITMNIAYDVEKAGKMEGYGHGAEYLLKNRKGVCHDYAELSRALLRAVGIKATYEKGEVHPAPGKREQHAWNRALIGETWYALDTTWGSGFVDEESGLFVQRPSRLYLTTPEELARLHGDPGYKETREIEWRRSAAAAAVPVHLSDHEDRLLELFNEARAGAGQAPLRRETRLLDVVRQSAVDAAERACRDEEYSLDRLNGIIEQKAPALRLSRAALYAFTLWDHPAPTPERLHRLIGEREDLFLGDGSFTGLAAAVIGRGDLITVVLVGLSYY